MPAVPITNLGHIPATRSATLQHLLLLTNGNLPGGGMERQVVCLQRQFVQRGVAVTLAVPKEEDGPAYVEWAAKEGGLAQITPALHLPFAIRTGISDIFTLARYIRQQKPTTVNFHFAGGWLALREIVAIRLAGHRPLCSIHSTNTWENMGEHRRRMTGLGGKLAGIVVANSTATRDHLLAADVPASRLRIVHCGVPEPKEKPTREAARRALGLIPEAFVVATACRLVEEKGITDLITALASVPAIPERPLILVIAGEGPERVALEKQATEMLTPKGHTFRFLGRLPSADELFAASDICALPSFSEAFGLVYIEAAMHARASVGLTACGVPEVVLSGETGLLVPPQNSKALTEALNRFYRSPELCATMGKAAQRHAARFSDSALADGYANLYRL